MSERKLNMGEGPIVSQMIRFVIPLILLGFVQQFFNVADVILAGHLGTSGLGISVTNVVISLAGFCGLRILWCLTVFRIEEYHTPQTLYIIYPISWLIIAVLRYVLFWYAYKKQKNKFAV